MASGAASSPISWPPSYSPRWQRPGQGGCVAAGDAPATLGIIRHTLLSGKGCLMRWKNLPIILRFEANTWLCIFWGAPVTLMVWGLTDSCTELSLDFALTALLPGIKPSDSSLLKNELLRKSSGKHLNLLTSSIMVFFHSFCLFRT